MSPCSQRPLERESLLETSEAVGLYYHQLDRYMAHAIKLFFMFFIFVMSFFKVYVSGGEEGEGGVLASHFSFLS